MLVASGRGTVYPTPSGFWPASRSFVSHEPILSHPLLATTRPSHSQQRNAAWPIVRLNMGWARRQQRLASKNTRRAGKASSKASSNRQGEQEANDGRTGSLSLFQIQPASRFVEACLGSRNKDIQQKSGLPCNSKLCPFLPSISRGTQQRMEPPSLSCAPVSTGCSVVFVRGSPPSEFARRPKTATRHDTQSSSPVRGRCALCDDHVPNVSGNDARCREIPEVVRAPPPLPLLRQHRTQDDGTYIRQSTDRSEPRTRTPTPERIRLTDGLSTIAHPPVSVGWLPASFDSPTPIRWIFSQTSSYIYRRFLKSPHSGSC